MVSNPERSGGASPGSIPEAGTSPRTGRIGSLPPLCGIVDYDAANMRSIGAALELIGLRTKIIRSPGDFRGLDRLVLPGVGAFGAAMDTLRARGLEGPILEWLMGDKPFLGICLGMQLLFEGSEEDAGCRGFGYFPGKMRRFATERVPCIGWIEVEPKHGSRLFDPGKREWFYFVHSYYTEANCPEASGFAEYGTRYACAVEKGRICGVQFHPEKSGDSGLALLRRWKRELE